MPFYCSLHFLFFLSLLGLYSNQEKPQNVDLPALRLLLLTEGERLTSQEYDALLRELLPPPPPEDPKKKKKKEAKKKKGEPDEPPPPPELTLSRFVDYMPKKKIEEIPVIMNSSTRK